MRRWVVPKRSPAGRDPVGPAPALPKRTRAPKGQGKDATVSFRCSAEFAKQLQDWAQARGVSVTDYIVQWMRTVLDFHGVPPEIAASLRRERAELGMDEFEYAYFMNFLRALEVRKKGPGFDLPDGDRRRLEIRKRKSGRTGG